MAAVSSVLSASTTTISSAQVTEASAASRFADSFRVMTVTVSFGTGGVYSEKAEGRRPALPSAFYLDRRKAVGTLSANRRDLDRFEVDQRLVVVNRGAQFGLPGTREI